MRPRRDQLFLRACSALGPEVARAVATARPFSGDDESDLSPGSAWLLAQRRSSSSECLRQALQSAARRGRAGAVIGAPSKPRAQGKKPGRAEVERQGNAQALRSAGVEPTPEQIMEALEIAEGVTEAEAALAGSAALLDSLLHSQGAELARSLGLSPRRGQQIRAMQRRALEAGQRDLFSVDEL